MKTNLLKSLNAAVERLTQPIVEQLTRPKVVRRYEQVMVLIALSNLGLVFFDMSYLPLRNFYLREFPLLVRGLDYIPESESIRNRAQILVAWYERIPESFLESAPFLAQGYDYIKGIEPNPETEEYLQTVERLRRQVIISGLESRETLEILEELRQQSSEIIENNPFEVANKTGTLETIKDRMREQVGVVDAKRAFDIFWSPNYLNQNGYRQELEFYENQIEPLMQTNYLRSINDETGDFVDRFARLDVFFAILFGFEFVIRTYIIHRTHSGLRWIDGMLWRWYDVFFFLPVFRWLRAIPVIIRLDTAKLIDLADVQKQVSQGFVASIAEDITEVVVLRVLNQVQSSVRRGNLAQMFSQENTREYIDLNDVDEISEMVRLVLDLVVERVLPKVQPEVEAFLRYNIDKAIADTPAYRSLSNLPGMHDMQVRLTERLVTQLYEALYGALKAAIEEDPVADELIQKLGGSLSEALTEEMQSKETLNRIQSLLDAFLEEVKVNYVERLSEQDVEELLEQKRRLRQASPRLAKAES